MAEKQQKRRIKIPRIPFTRRRASPVQFRQFLIANAVRSLEVVLSQCDDDEIAQIEEIWRHRAEYRKNKRMILDTISNRASTRLPIHARAVAAGTTVARYQEMRDILRRVEPWAGSAEDALSWYRGQVIPAFGDQTPEALVQQGKAAALRSYLDGIAVGGYA